MLFRSVGEDGKVVSFTRTEHEEDAEIAEVEKASEEEIAQAQAEENAEVIVEDNGDNSDVDGDEE